MTSLPQEETPDTYRVKTHLRPDMYELLTVFSYQELRDRRKLIPFPFATLLVPYNIRKYCRLFGLGDYRDYLRSSYAQKQALLTAVLQSTGVTRNSAEALSEGRHRYVPAGRRPFAYLNTSTAVDGDTNISAPGVVGHMLDATRHWTSSLTVEIGIGTGLHAIAMARIHPRMTILGIERNERVLQRLVANIVGAGLTDRIRVVGIGGAREALQSASQIYLTAAASQRQLRELIETGGPATDWLLPRQLSEHEFASEPASSWLKTRFGSYERYTASADWNTYCAIEAFTIDHELEPTQRSVMFDAAFVPFIT